LLDLRCTNCLNTHNAYVAARRYDEIVKGLTPFLKQCGYNPKKDLTFIPISALSGHNVKNRAPQEVRGR
jgi:translation elongation factor EF-1alpha